MPYEEEYKGDIKCATKYETQLRILLNNPDKNNLSKLHLISLAQPDRTDSLSTEHFTLHWNVSGNHAVPLEDLSANGIPDYIDTAAAVLEYVWDVEINQMNYAPPPQQNGQPVTKYHVYFTDLSVYGRTTGSGIDIPSANTIFINRGDHFGLSQLHQLRGRVGRSHHQAYCYVMVQSKKLITADATRRLQALEQLDELGAGFALAMNDMEIRGSGELLGESQSGVIDEVGFNMYTDLLNRAIRSLKAGKDITEQDIENDITSAVEIDLQIPARLPEDYLPDVHTRLIMYKRIANAKNAEELYELQIEMIDRFGLLPDEAKALINLTELRLQAMEMGITEIKLGESGGRVKFADKPNIDPMALIQLLQSGKGSYRMEGPQILHLMMELETEEQRLHAITELFKELRQGQMQD